MTNLTILNYQDLGIFFLRISLAIIFIFHGWPKISHLKKTRETFLAMLVPVPFITSLYSAIVEFFGGVFLLLGFYPQVVSLGLAIDMLGAMMFVTFRKGFVGGWEFDFALFVMSVTIFLSGPGSFVLSSLR